MKRILVYLIITGLMLAACNPVISSPVLALETPQKQTSAPLKPTQSVATLPPTLTMRPTPAVLKALATSGKQPIVERSSATPNDFAVDCKGAKPGDKLKLVYEWTGTEEDKLKAVFKPLVDACGIVIEGQAVSEPGRLGWKISGIQPDILFTSQVLAFTLYRSSFQDLTLLGGNAANYSSHWIDMGTVNGKWLAMPIEAENRSIIWYSPIQFKIYGYQVPDSLDELNSLVEQMVKDGRVPWSMGFEQGKATGALGANFIEDILLAQLDRQYIQNVISFKVLFNDFRIFQAFQLYKKWANDPVCTPGGAQGTLTTSYLEAIDKVFGPKPSAMMVRQSEIAADEIARQYPDSRFGIDYGFFLFPGLKDQQIGAQYLLALKDTPAVRAMTAYLSGPMGIKAWTQVNLGVSPNKLAVKIATDPLRTSEILALAGANSYVPSFEDAMPVIDDPPGRPFSAAQNEALVLLMEKVSIKKILDNVTEDEGDASLWNSSGALP